MSWVGPLAALLAGIAVLGVLAPFRRASRAALRRLSSPREDERLRLLRGLRDLERDRDRGALAEGEYERLRRSAEADAVALIHELGGRERSGELAAALRVPRHRGRGERRAAPGAPALVAALVAVAAVAATIPLLFGAAGARPGRGPDQRWAGRCHAAAAGDQPGAAGAVPSRRSRGPPRPGSVLPGGAATSSGRPRVRRSAQA